MIKSYTIRFKDGDKFIPFLLSPSFIPQKGTMVSLQEYNGNLYRVRDILYDFVRDGEHANVIIFIEGAKKNDYFWFRKD